MAKKNIVKAKKGLFKTNKALVWLVHFVIILAILSITHYLKGVADSQINHKPQNVSLNETKNKLNISLWEQSTENDYNSVSPQLFTNLQSVLGPNPHKTDLTNNDIQTVTLAKDSVIPATDTITITFNLSGKTKLLAITTRILGKVIGVVVNGRLLAAPRINQSISGGEIEVTSKFTEDEINQLPTSPNTDTTTWKAYSGEGFSLKFPDNWEFDPPVQNAIIVTFWPTDQPHIYPDVNRGGNSQMSIKIDNNSSLWSNIQDKRYYPDTHKIAINGRESIRYSDTALAIPLKNGGILLINTNEKQILDSILSTIRFSK